MAFVAIAVHLGCPAAPVSAGGEDIAPAVRADSAGTLDLSSLAGPLDVVDDAEVSLASQASDTETQLDELDSTEPTETVARPSDAGLPGRGADAVDGACGPVHNAAPDPCILGNCPTPCIDGRCLGSMIGVPSGSFYMGCAYGLDPHCHSDEKPAHLIKLSGFEIDRYEVTYTEYQTCVSAGACGQVDQTCLDGIAWEADFPVLCATWLDADAYCAWAGKRLCTEAEWEYAARGSDGRVFPWGNQDADCERAIMRDPVTGNIGCGAFQVWPVGSRPQGVSPFGALDMAGNVLEYVSDWYAADYYVWSPAEDPSGPESGEHRVARGGRYHSPAGELVSSRRAALNPDSVWPSAASGIRCCRTPDG